MTDKMARVPLVPATTDDPIVAPVFAAVRARGGEPLNMHRAVANAPPVFKAFVDLAWALRDGTSAPRVDRELAILRTCELSGGDYELAQHRPMALRAGLLREQVEAVAQWRLSGLFDARQQAILGYAEAVAGGNDVGDDAVAALAQHFNVREIVELTVTVAFYQASCSVTRALGVIVEDPLRQSSPSYG